LPRQAPRFRPPGWKPPAPWASSAGKSRQQRGYGSAHDAIRKQVLIEEPYCRQCIRDGLAPPSRSAIADHMHPQAEGGTGKRDNYQGLCLEHSKAKTSAEAARGRRRARTG